MTLSPKIEEGLLRYFAVRQQERADEVAAALARLSVPERRLLREAAVMGYVRGVMAGGVAARAGIREPEIPPDSAVVAEVVSCCQSMSDLYPFIAGLIRRRRGGGAVHPGGAP